MRELSCFGDSSIGVATAASSRGGALDQALQAAITSVYSAALSSGKEMLVRVTWTRTAAGATGLAVTFDDDEEGLSSSSSSRKQGQQLVLHKGRGSRSMVTSAGTVVGVHWDTTEAKYPDHNSSSPEPAGDYFLAVVADGELALLLGDTLSRRRFVAGFKSGCSTPAAASAVLVSRREQLRGAAAHVTRCRFREGGEEHEVTVHACRCGAAAGGGGELRVSIDGEKVAEVRRLGWSFRGNRAAVLPDGEVVDVMWDVHDWWFGGHGGTGAQFMVKARAEKEGRLWMADDTAAMARRGFFLHVQCYRR